MATKDRSEIALLGVFLAVAVAFVALTTTFRSESATLFPRLTGAVVVVGVILILLEDRLPGPLRRVVSEPVDLVDREEFESFEESDSDEESVAESSGAEVADSEPAETADERSLTSRQFLFAAVAGYVGLAYVFSILVATPAFVVAYGYWNRQRPLYVAGLVVASVAICLVFIWLANAPIDRGLLLPRGIF